MQSILSEQDCAHVNKAAARWKERIHRRNTLISWFNANKWDMRHPYLQAILNGNWHRRVVKFSDECSVERGSGKQAEVGLQISA
jgi:hypothetical protein